MFFFFYDDHDVYVRHLLSKLIILPVEIPASFSPVTLLSDIFPLRALASQPLSV